MFLQVSQLKSKIAEQRGEGFAVENQKLIYAGKCSKLLCSINISPYTGSPAVRRLVSKVVAYWTASQQV